LTGTTPLCARPPVTNARRTASPTCIPSTSTRFAPALRQSNTAPDLFNPHRLKIPAAPEHSAVSSIGICTTPARMRLWPALMSVVEGRHPTNLNTCCRSPTGRDPPHVVISCAFTQTLACLLLFDNGHSCSEHCWPHRGGLVRSDRISEFLSGIAVAIKLPILSLAAWRSMLHPASDRRGSNEAGFGYTSSGSCRLSGGHG
ncbi:MAG: hypothetical protein QOF74_2808, partial [Caballeronia mineralivorans]|nr:hypothetical protein [Caballeronia mineralivorans]